MGRLPLLATLCRRLFDAAAGHATGIWANSQAVPVVNQTGADIQMSFPLQAVAAVQSLERYPAIAAFVSRIEHDPAWKRVVDRAGPLAMPGQ